MNISFTAVLNTLLFSTIAIALFGLVIDRARVISGKISRFFSFIIVMIMLRLFIPFEILGLQNNVNLKKIYPDVYLFFTRPFLTFHEKEWSVLSILLVVSFIGNVICAMKLFLSYHMISHVLKKYRTVDDEIIKNLIIKINRELGQNVSFRIVCSREIATPFIFGLYRPVIVLPEISLSEKEWYYILSHEVAHFYHKDLWVRFACELLQVVYWWNPFIYRLRRQLIGFQERHVDTIVMRKLDEKQQMDYLSCLARIARLQSVVYRDKWVAEFNHKTEVQERIRRLLELQEERPMKKGHRAVNILLVVLLFTFTLILPNLVIFEPDGGIPDEILQNENYFLINKDNSYLLLNEEGKYEVYVNNEYKGTVTQIFDDTLPVYNKEGGSVK